MSAEKTAAGQTTDPGYGERSLNAWADRVFDEAGRLGLSLTQIMGLDSIALNALYDLPEDEQRWERAVRLSGNTAATKRALEQKGLLDSLIPTDRGIEIAKQAYAVCSQRDWDEDYKNFITDDQPA